MENNQNIESNPKHLLPKGFLDFILGRKNAAALRDLIDACLNSSNLSVSITGLLALLERPEIVDELAGLHENSDTLDPEEGCSLAVERLKLFLLLGMTVAGETDASFFNEKNGTTRNDQCSLFESKSKEAAENSTEAPLGNTILRVSDWYQTLGALRNHYEVLTGGRWIPVLAEESVLGYLRVRQNHPGAFEPEKDNAALILANRDPDNNASVELDLGDYSVDFLVDAMDNYSEVPLNGGVLRLTLGPLEGRLLLTNRWVNDLAPKRQSGILLHPTSLPSNFGIGDLGIGAMEFVDFLKNSGQKLWQILPLNPPGYGNSPYQCLSAFAGNPLLIDIDDLADQGLLSRLETDQLPFFPEERVSFEEVSIFKETLLRQAFEAFEKSPPHTDYLDFCAANQNWLEDYCLFMALKSYHGGQPWNQWEKGAASRQDHALAHFRRLLSEEISFHRFTQYEFFRQWAFLKIYAGKNGVKIIGDLPIYVAHDSADVWTNPKLFHLDTEGNPVKVAGVPPDAFTRTGQLWGNPIYRWEVMEETDFQWWKERLKHLAKMVDYMRIDHFRGFEAYWEVPAGEDTAVNGRWVKGPGEKFFEAISSAVDPGRIIAEDLGFITPEVERLKTRFGFPGMNIMQFEMQEEGFVVPIYRSHTVAYTGTHDNDTILGWHQKNVGEQPGVERSASEICWDYIRMAMHSDAETVIIPLQDILCLGSTARMNTPGTATRNWEWRFSSRQMEKGIHEKLKAITTETHR